MRAIFFAFLASLVFSVPVGADTISGRVVAIADGDTITVLDTNKIEYKIRLAGIDAPEKAQAFGERSKQHLSKLVFGKDVAVDWQKKDVYGRTVGKVLLAGRDVNLALVQAGLAWHYKKYQNEQSPIDRSAYEQAENAARAQKVGLWADAKPIPPSDFRHSTGDASPESRLQAGNACPCGSGVSCLGQRGGNYCMTNGGNRKYL